MQSDLKYCVGLRVNFPEPGILVHRLQSQESIKNGFGETNAPTRVASATPEPAALQPFSECLLSSCYFTYKGKKQDNLLQ